MSLSHFAQNRQLFPRNFDLKSKHAVLKASTEGPAAYVLPADEPRPGLQADLLRTLQLQGCEISRATAAFTVDLPTKPAPREDGPGRPDDEPAGRGARAAGRAGQGETTTSRTFSAGSYVVRMDQPYSRVADALLDYQYWAPDHPQRNPYDDTGWTFGETFGAEVVRVLDSKVLEVPMVRVEGEATAPAGVLGDGGVFLLNANADPSLAALRSRLRSATIEAAEEAFEVQGRTFNGGSFIITAVDREVLEVALQEAGLVAPAVASAPDVKRHPVRTPRIALVHTWLSTRTEGWWRQALDLFELPLTTTPRMSPRPRT